MEQACALVPEFKTINKAFLRKYIVAVKSSSCIRNYLMQISKMVVHFECNPLQLAIDQMEEYLFSIGQNEKPSLISLIYTALYINYISISVNYLGNIINNTT